MANRVKVLRNVPRTELLEEGWSKSRLASTMQCVAFDADAGKFIPSALPESVWREPNTGIIMLKPSALMAGYWEGSDFAGNKLDATQWHYASGSILSVYANGSMITKRASPTSALIDVLVDTALLALSDSMSTDMAWIKQLKFSLDINEGFSVWGHPPGIFTDRAADWMIIAFGQRYALHLRMDGTASLHSRSTSTSSDWKERVRFTFSQGGVEHNKPFQITVIPWGVDYITFLFTQAGDAPRNLRAAITSGTSSSFLYKISKYEDHFPSYEGGEFDRWVKTESGPISVAMRRFLFNYGLSWGRVTYPASTSFFIQRESLPDPKTNPVVITPRGYQSMGSSLTGQIKNEDNGTFTPGTDTEIYSLFTLGCDSSTKYSPELWSADLEVEPLRHTPNWTPIDISDQWSKIRFQRTTEHDVSTADVKLEKGDYSLLYKGWGPMQIQIDDVNEFDGDITRDQKTVVSFNSIVKDQLSCRDMWQRLNEKTVADYKFLDGLNLLEVVVAMLHRAGFDDTDIVTEDPDGIIASIQFQGFINPNDQMQMNQDGSVGDILREILDAYSLIPIRVRPVGGVWKIYLAPQYDIGTPPALTFFTGFNPGLGGDADNWDAGYYRILGNLQFTVEEPNFNALICRTATGSGDGAEGIQVSIVGSKVDPRSLSDPTYYYFMGRIKTKIVAPPEIVLAQDQITLNKVARSYWERKRKFPIVLEVEAEWQPEVDVDKFVTVLGINPAGETVSYGAFRIDNIDIQIMQDFTDKPESTYEWSGNYNLVYVGRTGGEIPMFSEEIPE